MDAKRLVKASTARLGFYVSRRPYGLQWTLHDLFQRAGINVVIDVGGHWGEYGTMLRRDIGYQGRIVSFEPASEAFQQLTKAMGTDTAWRARRLALGAEAGTATLNTFESTVFNSLLDTTGEGTEKFGALLDRQGTETVEVATLTDMWESIVNGIAKPRVYLKLDTQGYDSKVIEGGLPIMEYVTALQTELPVTRIYDGAMDLVDSLGMTGGMGFRPIGFFPVNYEADAVNVVEFDCVLARFPL